MPQPLPRYESRLAAQDARKVERIVAETADAAPMGAAGQTAAGDGRRLRGIPAVSRHTSGAIPWTNPLAALLAKQR